jgi:hypothetical protein
MKLLYSHVDDLSLLPHFIKHYEKRGIDTFIMGIPISLEERWNEAVDTSIMWRLQKLYAQPNEWIALADLDEFINVESLPAVVERAERESANYVSGELVDRIDREGFLHQINYYSDLESLFPLRTSLSSVYGTSSKVFLIKGQTKFYGGHHTADGKGLSAGFQVDHFKWNSNVIERLEKRNHMRFQLGLPHYGIIINDIFKDGRLDMSKVPLYKP